RSVGVVVLAAGAHLSAEWLSQPIVGARALGMVVHDLRPRRATDRRQGLAVLSITATRASCHSRCGAERKRRDFPPALAPVAAGTSLCLGWLESSRRSIPEVGELQRHVEPGIARQPDRFLQFVAALAADAHLLVLNRGLHFQLRILDQPLQLLAQ